MQFAPVVTAPVSGYPVFIVGAPQLSAAVGATKELVGSAGLQVLMVIDAVPVTVGFSASADHERVCTKGSLSLPQASTYIHVLVWVLVQLAPVVTVLVCG